MKEDGPEKVISELIKLHLPHFHKYSAAMQLHGASVHHQMTSASVKVKSLPITLIHSS